MRWLVAVVALSTFAGCTPCRTWAEKANQCSDLAEGFTVDSAEAVCKQLDPSTGGLSQTEWDCMLNCAGRSATCTQYFERMYLTCECADQCGIPCSD